MRKYLIIKIDRYYCRGKGIRTQSLYRYNKPLVVTAPSSKAVNPTCLSQLYHSTSKDRFGYSKFETFPVWNKPLKHPLNIAYEAATIDLKDVNMIDNFHHENIRKLLLAIIGI